MRTEMRWATLVKFPVALSGLMMLNSDPAARGAPAARQARYW